MRAIGYVRVSSAEQAAGGISLTEVQAPHCAKVCLARGWDLEEVYADAGYSGAEWAKRPGLQRLLRRLAGPDPPGALVVYKLDRTGRKARYVHRLLEALEAAGAVLVSATEPQFSTDTPMGRAMLGMAAVFAEFERDQIVERVTDAMQAIAEAGRWKGGHVPFGYDYVRGKGDNEKGHLAPSPTEAPLVRLAFSLYVEEHLGLRPITARLAAASGKRLTVREVSRMLERRTYEGLVPHNGMLYPGRHEAIVDPGLAARARQLRALRRSQFPHGERVQYLLSGLLRCRHCGAPMTGCTGSQKGGPNVKLYRCTRATVYGEDGRRCPGSFIRCEKAHRALVSFVRDSGAAAAVGPIEDPPALALESPEEESIGRQLAALPARRQRLVDYASRGTITEGDLTGALAGLETEEGELRRTLAELRRPVRTGRRQVRRLFRDVAALLESAEVELQRKRDLLLATFSALVIEPGGDVHYRLAR